MNRREAIKKIGLTATALSAIPLIQKCATSESDRPNIILIVADNLGRESVGYYGSQLFKTPHLDRMAASGVVFDNCLIATPICSLASQCTSASTSSAGRPPAAANGRSASLSSAADR